MAGKYYNVKHLIDANAQYYVFKIQKKIKYRSYRRKEK